MLLWPSKPPVRPPHPPNARPVTRIDFQGLGRLQLEIDVCLLLHAKRFGCSVADARLRFGAAAAIVLLLPPPPSGTTSPTATEYCYSKR